MNDLVCGEMFEQGKEVCACLSAIFPVSYPTLTLSPVHALNDGGSLLFPFSTMTQNPFELVISANQVLAAACVSF